MGVYRFLLTPRWLGILALTLAASAVMVLLGNWQLSRYQERAAINERIDTTAKVPPVPVGQVLPVPAGTAGALGAAPPADAAWTRVTVTGRYDSTNVILIRSRTVESQVGFEVLTPLLLPDGSAVLVDRGWIPPAPGGSALARPEVPTAPSGEVTVVGRVHLSESKPDAVVRRDGRIETRRIALPALARELPYPIYHGYLLLDEQTPAADPIFSAIPIRHENDWQNGGYVVQWWLFAVLALVGFGWAARREARGGGPGSDGRDRDRAGQDRLGHDRLGQDRLGQDRLDESAPAPQP
ncbi:SURF1 family protein [Plantactinospora sp. S1510]|uniref:SURF1-like protein n=1 Tax=Plantactinospora alkalitolerans TaxID=2789879 RepID=A0ABS0GNF8_9ACTN|nr:SURF1 family protein [Plantactinospora alkalitolerans]MBF9127723.1 SURF1 family protein [Plantactinospora alkalitolerans]